MPRRRPRTRELRSLAGITICGRNLAFPVAEIKGGALMSGKEREIGREERATLNSFGNGQATS